MQRRHYLIWSLPISSEHLNIAHTCLRMKSRKKDVEFDGGSYDTVHPANEDEILGCFSDIVGDSPDFHLYDLPRFLDRLNIPSCFTKDLIDCVEYYYDFIHPEPDLRFDPSNVKQYTTINFIRAYAISSSAKSLREIIDIVDIDKLIANTDRLIKYRNEYNHILASWKLFVSQALPEDKAGPSVDEDYAIGFRLGLPELKTIKSNLNLNVEKSGLSDSILIDMLSATGPGADGIAHNFDFEKPKHGIYVTIKDFAHILGQIGELG